MYALNNLLFFTPETEIRLRLQNIQFELQKKEIDGLLITQNMDLLYFSGSMQNGVLFIHREKEPTFYVKKSVQRASNESVFSIEEMGRLSKLGQRIEEKYGVINGLGIEEDVIPYKLAIRYVQSFSQAQAISASSLIRKVRAVKSSHEIELIRQSAEKVNHVIQSLSKHITVGMTELELVAEIEYQLRLQGNFNIYRVRGYNQELVLGMVASGKTAAIPSYFDGPAGGVGLSTAYPLSASMQPIQANEPILIDIAAVTEGYLIDQTRMAVVGQLTDTLQKAYQVSLKILRDLERLAKPGVAWEAPYLHALQLVEAEGLADHFMGYGADQAKFVGHGIGLEIDELPILAKGFTQPLVKGMVVAIEPKFTFPDLGVIGIENTYVVQDDGLSPLTQSSEEIIYI